MGSVSLYSQMLRATKELPAKLSPPDSISYEVSAHGSSVPSVSDRWELTNQHFTAVVGLKLLKGSHIGRDILTSAEESRVSRNDGEKDKASSPNSSMRASAYRSRQIGTEEWYALGSALREYKMVAPEYPGTHQSQ